MAVFTTPQEPTRRRRPLGPLLLVAALLVAVTATLLVLHAVRDPAAPAAVKARFTFPTLDVAPGSAVPFAGDAVPATNDWVTRVAGKTDIPQRTLRAYAAAETQLRTRAPRCQVSWATLAGVGGVESHHGRFGRSDVGTDGLASPPIIGVALDGSPGVRAIKDTDGGRLDGDRRWDRAVGVMQFLPATWARWATRASGDGQPPDPQHVDDAALAAARYLCASSGTLGTGNGWWKAVLTYNQSVAYARKVFSAADAYARAAATLS